jgi:serine protease inhibitor
MQQHKRVFRLGTEIGALVVAAAALGGCGSSVSVAVNSGGPPNGMSNAAGPVPAAVVQAQKEDTPVDPAIVAADNAFGLNLLNTLLPGSSGNVAISPISVALALQIVYNGAAGATQQAMAQTLQLGSLSAQELNSDNAALQASLINPDPKVQLTIANSLWMHLADNRVLPSFTQIDEIYYGATLGDLSGAPDNVNAWVGGETHGLITQILPQEPAGYYAQATAVIANAIYFKGQWTTPFDATLTTVAPFTLSDGTQVSAELMHQTGDYEYFEGSLRGTNFQAVRLPYGKGRLSMLIVLPDSGTRLDSFVSGMTAEELGSWGAQFQTSQGSIALPRFSSSYGKSLPAALTALGMGVAFDRYAADFSELAQVPPPIYIYDVEHKTVVEVMRAVQWRPAPPRSPSAPHWCKSQSSA